MTKKPVVIGLGITQQKGSYAELDEALFLMEKVAMQAINDCGNSKIKDFIDVIDIPKGFWRYRDPGKWIAEKNNFSNAKTSVNKIGVLQQHLINNTCNKIIKGEIRAGLILGGESRAKMIAALKEGIEYKEMELSTNPDQYVKAKDDLYGEGEAEALGLMAVGYYAVMESAMRKSKSLTLKEHEDYLGSMYADFSEIASKNQYAASDKSISKDQIMLANSDNKPMAYPYNKYHCTSWNVSQASAILICEEGLADQLNISKQKRIYPMASSETNHMIALIQRPSLISSAGLKLASEKINEVVDKHSINLNLIDLYSCFPVAVQQFENVLNLNTKTSRTITGAMPFAGGPLNNYMLHATVQALLKLRSESGHSLITGVSGMMTKQSFCLWSSEYQMPFYHADVTKKAQQLDKPIPISNAKHGNGIVIGYTVLYEGTKPTLGVFYIEDSQGERKVVTSEDKAVITSMREEEWIEKEISFYGNQVS
ncbi:MAG: acetyl-CoA acetyltransferase [Pseudomonadota bacterium]|nr:acetyl-CoA acetyltransferase [Gammaproteobacteria bacterium]MEC8465903.1 acetyl-CoA acetyltransferase [Pseudomonadota bacterium]|tara:strand:- start:4884 stop:6329 length:1446 start_codon:yes stop_codon:yes gene_type:complete